MIKRALLAVVLLMMFMSADAATRKKISTKKDKQAQPEVVAQPEPVAEPVVEVVKEVKDIKKKKDISDMGARKLEKMKALQAMNSSGIINFSVSEYK